VLMVLLIASACGSEGGGTAPTEASCLDRANFGAPIMNTGP
jgi:hypothetical protein